MEDNFLLSCQILPGGTSPYQTGRESVNWIKPIQWRAFVITVMTIRISNSRKILA
jgi:hypothetical protein